MTYAEARNAVTADLTDSLGEAGLRALIARVRRDTPVHIHPRAIQLMMAAR
jgi:hypothetical protein